MVAYQEKRQVQARLRALTAVNAVVLGSTALTLRRLPTGTTSTRATATTTTTRATTRTTAATRAATTSMASALFAPRSNPIWVQKEGSGLASGAAAAGEAARLEHSFCEKLV